MGFGNVIKRHHYNAEEQHRWNRADPVPVRGQYPVLIGGASPTHELKRTEVCRKKAETRDPCGHLAPSHEIIFASICALLEIKANRQNEREIENNNGQVDRRKMNEPLGAHRSKGSNHGRGDKSPLIASA